jgi:beta-glucosidase
MKKTIILLSLLIAVTASTVTASAADYKYGKVTEKTTFIKNLMKRMTLDEKVEQCDLVLAGRDINSKEASDERAHITKGAGAVFNVKGAATARAYQKVAVEETRLGIPLLFGFDCIHGMQTDFPIPLASACSWDMSAIEMAERVAAEEASVQGVNWVFSPMLDIARDARWGRIAEGAGEDPYLGAAVARARVKGFQGNDLSAKNTVATCVKHYVTYGAAESGRDYNCADMSESRLREVYLPPYRAAFVDAGAATTMCSFNSYNGVPVTCNPFLLRKVLKDEYKFKGFVVSDYEAVMELLRHNVACDSADAARVAMIGGLDMDMKAFIYSRYLANEVKSGKVNEKLVDDACARILGVKYDLGLFNDPYRYVDETRENQVILSADHIAKAREVAKRSIVLLKNDGGLLPLSKSLKKITLIGEMGNSKGDMMGCWAVAGRAENAVTILQGLKNAVPNTEVAYSLGYNVGGPLANDNDALNAVKDADVVLMAMGENAGQSGEGRSMTKIEIPEHQMALFHKIKAAGKKVVVLLNNGRPIALPQLAKEADAIVETWFLGTEAGDAIADVIFGDYNPSGKLTTSFPTSTGQEPLYYNQLPTGRPYFQDHNDPYRSKFQDVPFDPVFPFGYGLSYTTFKYSNLRLSADKMNRSGKITVSVDITNTGKVAGEEVAQMYLQDIYATVSRPMLELKGFDKIMIQPGETKTAHFDITNDALQFWKEGQGWISEPGTFKVMVGGNSVDLMETKFNLAE